MKISKDQIIDLNTANIKSYSMRNEVFINNYPDTDFIAFTDSSRKLEHRYLQWLSIISINDFDKRDLYNAHKLHSTAKLSREERLQLKEYDLTEYELYNLICKIKRFIKKDKQLRIAYRGSKYRKASCYIADYYNWLLEAN